MRTHADTAGAKRPGAHKTFSISLLCVLLAVLSAMVGILFSRDADPNTYAPDSALPRGSAAVVSVLRSRGVSVIHTTDAETLQRAAGGTTVLVTDPDALDAGEREQLAHSEADVIILAHRRNLSLPEWGFPLYVRQRKYDSPLAAKCADPDAKAAGSLMSVDALLTADKNGEETAPPGRLSVCFSHGDGFAWATSKTNPHISVFTGGKILTNQFLPKKGNAVFALRKLGRHNRLFWVENYRPRTPENTPAEGREPAWMAMFFSAAAMCALWYFVYRGRRFGKPVPEPLPVTVPAGEAAAGRAKLYAQSRDFPYLAEILRSSFLLRHETRLGLRKNMDRAQIVKAVSAAVHCSTEETDNILFGKDIPGEKELKQLQEQLRKWEEEMK